jgi:hypothetical protein
MFVLRVFGGRAAMLAAALVAVAPGASQRLSAQRPSPVAVRGSFGAVSDSAALAAVLRARGSALVVSSVAADSTAAKRRSPLVAGFLGVLPGVGHMYAGETRRGLAVGGIWLGSGLVMFGGADRAVTSVAAVVNIATYVFSIADAALAAERFNARHAPGTTHAE